MHLMTLCSIAFYVLQVAVEVAGIQMMDTDGDQTA